MAVTKEDIEAWEKTRIDCFNEAMALFSEAKKSGRVFLIYDSADMPLVENERGHQVICHKGYDLWMNDTAGTPKFIKPEATKAEALTWLTEAL